MIGFLGEKFLATSWASFDEDFGYKILEHLATLKTTETAIKSEVLALAPGRFIVVICWFSPVYGKIHEMNEMFAYIVSVIER